MSDLTAQSVSKKTAETAKPSPVGTELDQDVSAAASAISIARINPSKPLFTLDANNPTFGSGSIQEKAIAKVVQTALNESFEKLGDSTRVKIDGDIRRAGATEKAIDHFHGLENKNRPDDSQFGGSGPAMSLTVNYRTLAALSKYSDTLNRGEFDLSKNVSAQIIRDVAPVLDGSNVLRGVGGQIKNDEGKCISAIHQLAKIALGKDDEMIGKLSGTKVGPATLAALTKILGTDVVNIGPKTVSALIEKAVEADRSQQ